MMTRRVQLNAPVPFALRLWQQTQAGPKLAVTAGEGLPKSATPRPDTPEYEAYSPSSDRLSRVKN
jgi:hypothetical protein